MPGLRREAHIRCLYQFSEQRHITRSGKAASRFKKTKPVSMECTALFCVNDDFMTDYTLDVIEPQNAGFTVHSGRDDTFYITYDQPG